MLDRMLIRAFVISMAIPVGAARSESKAVGISQPSTPAAPAAPVEERLPDARGREVATLVYRLADDQPPARRFTIAQRRWIGSRIGILPSGRRNVTIRCPLLSDGTIVSPDSCVAEDIADDYAHDIRQQLGRILRPAIPPIPAAESEAVPRALRYSISFDHADWPGLTPLGDSRTFDRASSAPIIGLLLRQLREDFPALPLTMRLEARVTLQCFVESDRSVSCRVHSVDPAVADPYYRSAISSILPRGRLPERLSDGTPTPGLTFRVPFQYVIDD
jgi:hypothetical protein